MCAKLTYPQKRLELNASRCRSISGDPDEALKTQVDDALDERLATECGVGKHMNVPVPLTDFQWKSAEQLEGEHGRRGLAFATPDQERPGEAERTTAEKQDDDVNTMHPIQRMHPTREGCKLPLLSE